MPGCGRGRLNPKGRAVASKSQEPNAGGNRTDFPALVRRVKLRKRLDLARDAERSYRIAVPGLNFGGQLGGTALG